MSNNEEIELLEVKGRVTKVLNAGIKNSSISPGPIFVIFCPNSSKEYVCDCSKFICPIEENDAIYCICRYGNDKDRKNKDPRKVLIVLRLP